MTFVKGIQHWLQRSRHGKGMLLKPGFHRLQCSFLIPFHGEHIVGFLFDNRLGDGFLAAYSVNGDQSTGKSQTSEESRNGGNLVGFAVNRYLPYNESLFTCPRTRPAAVVSAPASDQMNVVPSFHRWQHGLSDWFPASAQSIGENTAQIGWDHPA